MPAIVQKFISKNRSGVKFTPSGIVLHETANPEDNSEMEFNYFDKEIVQASAHAFVDADTIIQTIPWNEKAWHAGPTANGKFIGIELCHSDDPVKFKKIWGNGVWLCAWLYTNLSHVIVPDVYVLSDDSFMSHAQVSSKYKETDHMDPVSYFAKHDKTVQEFVVDVQFAIDNIIFDRMIHFDKIITTPQHWQENCINGKFTDGAFVQQVIKNFVAMFYFCNNFDECLCWMIRKNMMNDPAFWKNNAVPGGKCDGIFSKILLVRMGRFLKL